MNVSGLLSKRIILLAAIACAVYLNSLGGGFVWDDSGLIAGNEEYLENVSNLASVFFEPHFEAPYYRPLLWASFFLDYSVWGQNPFGFHITNVVLHIINTLLVCWFIGNLGFSQTVSFITASLFATHPVQTEAIAWISGRNDPLLVLFLLLAFNFLLKARTAGQFPSKLTYYCISAATFACALLTKEIAIIALPLMVLTDLFYQRRAWEAPVRRETILLYGAFILVLCCFFLLRSFAFSERTSHFSFQPENLSRALITPLAVYAYYFKVMFFPFNLTVSPVSFIGGSSVSDTLFIIAFLACILLGLLVVHNARRATLFGIMWIVVYLLPVSGLVWMGVPILEHRLYGASIAFCLMLASLCCHMADSHNAESRPVHRIIGYGTLLVLMIMYGYLTIDRNRVWNNDVTIWTDTIKKAPPSVMALNNLASALIKEKNYDLAISHIKTALKLNARAEKLYGNLGLAHSHRKDFAEAIAAFEMALKLKPRSAETYNNMGMVFKETGNEEKALSCFQKAVELKPQFSKAYLNRGTLYLDRGDKTRARVDYQTALQFAPHNSSLHNALGLFYAQEGDVAQAVTHYQKAINLNPGNYEALNNISLLYCKQKAYDKALPHQIKALAINPASPELHLNLGLIYFNTGKINEAIEAYTQALTLNPAYLEAHFNIATAYLLVPDGTEKSREHFNRVLTLKPDYQNKELIKRVLSSIENQQ
jgi:tetratricopeptide (TPR) repeat protein